MGAVHGGLAYAFFFSKWSTQQDSVLGIKYGYDMSSK